MKLSRGLSNNIIRIRFISTINIIKGDISDVKNMDVIVTSANELLMGNKNSSYWRFNGRHNVDGSIREKLDQDILDRQLDGKKLKVGESIILESSGLIRKNQVKFIIHTVTPDGAYGFDCSRSCHSTNPEKLLSSCYKSSLALADERRCSSLAFPALGCGVKEWIVGKAALIAFETLINSKSESTVTECNFIIRESSTFTAFKKVGIKVGLKCLDNETTIENENRCTFKR